MRADAIKKANEEILRQIEMTRHEQKRHEQDDEDRSWLRAHAAVRETQDGFS
jgi:hypothetical protein